MNPDRVACANCGGWVVTERGPGRVVYYGRARVELPLDLAVERCTTCGASWVGGDYLRRVEDLLNHPEARP